MDDYHENADEGAGFHVVDDIAMRRRQQLSDYLLMTEICTVATGLSGIAGTLFLFYKSTVCVVAATFQRFRLIVAFHQHKLVLISIENLPSLRIRCQQDPMAVTKNIAQQQRFTPLPSVSPKQIPQ